MGHAYVFLFFFLTTVACCLVIFMWNSDFKMFEQKEFVKIKMNRSRISSRNKRKASCRWTPCSVK